jgi:outer membrane protein assembly factor BamB
VILRRKRGDRVLIDLGALEEAGPDEGPWPDEGSWSAAGPWPIDDLDEADPETDDAAVARAKVQRTRQIVVFGMAGLLALSVWGATAEIDGRRQAERLMVAPGGVLSLAEAPREAWSTGTESADATAYMPGLVVVRRGTVLHGMDAGTGAERWRVPVGGDPRCGVAGEVVDPLVCWSGPNAAPRVTVVHTDGSSTTRALPADVVWAAGTADGELATLTPIGPKPPDNQVAVAGDGTTILGTLQTGQDVVVRLEDAATGAQRWQQTVPFHSVTDPWTCGSISPDPSGGQPIYTYTASPPTLSVAPGLIQVDGCGVRAAFTPDGTPTADGGHSAWWIAEPYVDGGVLEQVGGYQGAPSAASVLHSPSGKVAMIYGAQVLNPWATDGTPSDLVLTGSPGMALTAISTDGVVHWKSAHTYGALLVRTASVALLTRASGGIAAVDLRTGEELWSRLDLPAPDSTVPPRAAFTDGRFVALAVDTNDGNAQAASGDTTVTTTELIALDLATGATQWTTTLPAGGSSLVAVQGHIVDTAQRGFTSLDDEGSASGFVDRSPGTVHVLG